MKHRFYASFFIAGLAGMIAHRAGIPLWNDWDPGDAADLMLVAFLAAWFTLSAIAQPESPS